MKKCNRCGFEDREDSQYCTNCGNKLTDSNSQGDGNNKKHKGLLIIALIIIVALVIGGVFIVKTALKSSDSKLASDNAKSGDGEAYYRVLSMDDVANENGTYYADSQILLTAAGTATFKEVESLVASEYGGEIVGYISTTNDYQILFGEGKTYAELESIVEVFKENSLITEASLSYIAEIATDSVDYSADPWIDADDTKDTSGSRWDKDRPDGKNWWAEAISMPAVWDLDIEYQTVKVGIIDTMFDITNEDLDEDRFAKLWNNPQDEEGNCNVTDIYNSALSENNSKAIKSAFHGTHVSGIIAAQAENGFGIAGVSQNAKLYGYSVSSASASTSSDASWGDIFMFKCAMAQLLNEGVKVINISLTFEEAFTGAQEGNASWQSFLTTNSQSIEVFLEKYINAGNDFLIIKSAGNLYGYDASFDIFGAITNKLVADRIIIVGAADYSTNGYYNIADFSCVGSRVDVYAPGVDILSDMPTNVTALKSGTSMSAPIVSGMAALVWGINPNLGAEQVRSIILASTYASMFNLDGRLSIFKNLVELWADVTPIADAYICVQLAQNTVGNSRISSMDVGTVTGMIYSVSSNGEDFKEISIDSIAIYDEQDTLVKELEAEHIAFYQSSEDSGEAERVITLQSYSELLETGKYIIKVSAEGYGEQQQEVTITTNEIKVVDFSFEPNIPNVMDYLDDFDKLLNVMEMERAEQVNSEGDTYISSEKDGLSYWSLATTNDFNFLNNGFVDVSVSGVMIEASVNTAVQLLENDSWYQNTIDYGDESDTGYEYLTFYTRRDDNYYQFDIGYSPQDGIIRSWYLCNTKSDYARGICAYNSVAEGWKKAYINYIMENGMNNMSNTYQEIYKLVNINNDSIPELYINFGSTAGGDILCSYYNDSVLYQYMWNYGFSYMEGQNLFMDSGGHMDGYYDKIYSIQDGEFVLVYNGEYGASDNSDVQHDSNGTPIYNYYWNGTQVSSEEEYQRLLDNVYNKQQAMDPYDGAEYNGDALRYVGNGLCDYREILEEIINYNTSDGEADNKNKSENIDNNGISEEEAYNLVKEYWTSLGNLNMPQNVETFEVEDGYEIWGYYLTDTHASTNFRFVVNKQTGKIYDTIKAMNVN